MLKTGRKINLQKNKKKGKAVPQGDNCPDATNVTVTDDKGHSPDKTFPLIPQPAQLAISPQPTAHQPSADANGKHHHPFHCLVSSPFLFTREKNGVH